MNVPNSTANKPIQGIAVGGVGVGVGVGSAKQADQIFAAIFSIQMQIRNAASFFCCLFSGVPVASVKFLWNEGEGEIRPETSAVTAALPDPFAF
jgi:hypothetical protein